MFLNSNFVEGYQGQFHLSIRDRCVHALFAASLSMPDHRSLGLTLGWIPQYTLRLLPPLLWILACHSMRPGPRMRASPGVTRETRCIAICIRSSLARASGDCRARCHRSHVVRASRVKVKVDIAPIGSRLNRDSVASNLTDDGNIFKFETFASAVYAATSCVEDRDRVLIRQAVSINLHSLKAPIA